MLRSYITMTIFKQGRKHAMIIEMLLSLFKHYYLYVR